MKKFLIIIIALLFFVSCSKDSGQKGSYVIKIDDTVLTQKDIQDEMKALPDIAKEFFQGPEGTTRFVDELVKKELLYLEAKKRGFDKYEEFQRKIEEFKKIALINKLLEKEIEASPKVTDKDIRDYYDKHKEEFTQNTQVRLSQIVVKTEEDAKKAYERLQKGEDFKTVAADMSQDKQSAKAGGDIGTFKKGEMNPALEHVAFRLKKGQVSMPIKLKDGIHILTVTDSKGTLEAFEKAKGRIHQQLIAKKQQESFDKFIDTLKKSRKIDINKDEVSKITFAPTQPSAPEQKK